MALYDAALSFAALVPGSRPVPIRMEVGGLIARGEAVVEQADDGNYRWGGWFRPDVHAPGTLEGIEERAVVGATQEFTLARLVRRRRVSAGWLKSAYLAAFAAFGYSYVLQPAFDQVRRQILLPGEAIINVPIKEYSWAPAEIRRLGVVVAPNDLAAVLVQIGRYVVSLPSLNSTLDFYPRLLAARKRSLTRRDTVYELPWPASPMLALDG